MDRDELGGQKKTVIKESVSKIYCERSEKFAEKWKPVSEVFSGRWTKDKRRQGTQYTRETPRALNNRNNYQYFRHCTFLPGRKKTDKVTFQNPEAHHHMLLPRERQRKQLIAKWGQKTEACNTARTAIWLSILGGWKQGTP